MRAPGSPTRAGRRGLAYLQLSGTALFWGANFIVAKILMEEWPPDRFSGVRIAFAALMLAAVATWRGQRWRWPAAAWGCLAAAGAVGIGLNNALLYGGLRVTSAAHASLIMALSPVGTAAVMVLSREERFTALRALAMLLAVAGAAVVILPVGGPAGAAGHAPGAVLHGGDLAVFGAMACSSISFLFLKRGLRHVDPLSATAVTLTAGALVLLPPAIGEHMRAGAGAPGVVAVLLASAVLSMGLGTLWWNAGVAALGAQRTVVFNDVVPAVTLALGALFIHAPITWRDVAGFVLIGAAVAVNVLPDGAPAPPTGATPVRPGPPSVEPA